MIGASVTGASHLRNGLPCQDAHSFASLRDGIAIAAVADGMGSAAEAGIGSSLAVEVALMTATRRLKNSSYPKNEDGWILFLRACFYAARTHLEEEARLLDLPVRELGTTLLLAVTVPGWLAVAHIGDGAIVAQDGSGALETVALPQSGEYANETFSLAQPEALDLAQFYSWPVQPTALALFSDGLQRLALRLPACDPHPPFFAPLFRQLSGLGTEDQVSRAEKALKDFLASDRVAAHSDDDCTLVLVGRREPAGVE